MHMSTRFVQTHPGVSQLSNNVSGSYPVAFPAGDGGQMGIQAVKRAVLQLVLNDHIAAVIAMGGVGGGMDYRASGYGCTSSSGVPEASLLRGLMSIPS